MDELVWFRDITKDDIATAGGKGANLGELYRSGIPVPNGFIVTSNAYFEAVRENGAIDRIRGILFNLDPENPTLLDSKASQCQQEILNLKLPPKLESEIAAFYKKLSNGKKIHVAVRSSATAEDLPGASFAGQQATFLNISGIDELKKAILSCWASLFNARAIFYREEKKFDYFKVGIAVPVQKMVESETSGIMFTVDPITGDKNRLVIEAIFGLGEMIVSGQTTPDHYEYDKKKAEIIQKTIVAQKEMMVKSAKDNKIIPVSRPYQKVQKLPDEKIIELAKIGEKVEAHYYFPQDLEWAYEDGELYIVQSRPITTLKEKSDLEKISKSTEEDSGKEPLVIGAPASPAIAWGPVVIIKSPKELDKVKKGDVLVAEMTNPDYVPAMRRASAIVTDKGGRTSHAAIVSRELGIACVVGTQNATKKLKNGMIVTVNGAKGHVFAGQPQKGRKDLSLDPSKKRILPKVRKTATHVYVNLAEPHLAAEIAAKEVDGIGLLRAEFILAQIGKHPKEFLREQKGEEFTKYLSKNLAIFAKNFDKRPVIYRASDLKSNEYRNLKGGDKFEPNESNPMLGYRGAFRYIKDPDTFKLELDAILEVRKKHKNLHLMIPFVRSVNELVAVRSLVERSGLFKDPEFKFWMMVEIPVNVILLEDFIKVGIDGVSIGSNDLTMLILGTDRDNEEVATEFNEMSPAVLWALERIVKTCAKHQITASICGQAPSIFPELTEKLVSWGITSISVNPDVIDSTREIIYQAEEKLVS